MLCWAFAAIAVVFDEWQIAALWALAMVGNGFVFVDARTEAK
jgi:hypothetical protein